MRLLLLLLLLFRGSVAAAEERAFLEMETPRDTYFIQEPIRLTLRIGFDREFFRTNVVPPNAIVDVTPSMEFIGRFAQWVGHVVLDRDIHVVFFS